MGLQRVGQGHELVTEQQQQNVGKIWFFPTKFFPVSIIYYSYETIHLGNLSNQIWRSSPQQHKHKHFSDTSQLDVLQFNSNMYQIPQVKDLV